MIEITARCRAKVNLTLDILDRRPDGYHSIESVVQSIDLYDTLRVRRTEAEGVVVTVDAPEVPSGPANTVYAAAAAFRDAVESTCGVAVSIVKRIPAQAGLGGGSSDAAGAILALNELSGSPLSKAELARLAGGIGSDVPFFLTGGAAVIRGRGERVDLLPSAPPLDLVIVKPDFGVSTSEAYRWLDEAPNRRSRAATAGMVEAVRRNDRLGVMSWLSNDFEAVVEAEYPEIVAIRRRMAELGAEASLLCGSGSAVFGAFPGPEEAHRACEALRSHYPFAVTVRTAPTAVTLGEDNVDG